MQLMQRVMAQPACAAERNCLFASNLQSVTVEVYPGRCTLRVERVARSFLGRVTSPRRGSSLVNASRYDSLVPFLLRVATRRTMAVMLASAMTFLGIAFQQE